MSHTDILSKSGVFFSSFSGSVREIKGKVEKMMISETGSAGPPVGPVKLIRKNSVETEEQEKELEWLFHPSLIWESRADRIQDSPHEETRVLVGEYLYWVRISRETPELCRTCRHYDNLVVHEVLHHQNLGVTDDDLDEVIRHTRYPFASEFRISDRVKRKLQVLHER
jgi:hypothetical protein